jgi:hypothetical protein
VRRSTMRHCCDREPWLLRLGVELNRFAVDGSQFLIVAIRL